MTFKDILPDDDFSMLDLDEMGELVKIDGVILKAVIDKHTAKKSGNEKKNFKMLFKIILHPQCMSYKNNLQKYSASLEAETVL